MRQPFLVSLFHNVSLGGGGSGSRVPFLRSGGGKSNSTTTSMNNSGGGDVSPRAAAAAKYGNGVGEKLFLDGGGEETGGVFVGGGKGGAAWTFEGKGQVDETLCPQVEGTVWSTTENGTLGLARRTIAKEVFKQEIIGSGRFGEVWRATWRSDNVAVKIFKSIDEESFKREQQIYETKLLQHENILCYICSDIMDLNDHVRYILVTAYCEFGSLHDFLKSTPVKFEEAVSLIRSAAAGLDFLHNSLEGTNNISKPPIAHRDIKSKNILVKRNFVCVIADFGLAVRLVNGELEITSDERLDTKKANHKVGTIRYMPPEILAAPDSNITFNSLSFEAYRQADMYSFALVMWEVANRCYVNDFPADNNCYKVPYEDMVCNDPSVSEMRRVVVEEKKRPTIPCEWKNNNDYCYSNNTKVQVFARLMTQCWSEDPNARLTSRNVKKTLTKYLAPI